MVLARKPKKNLKVYININSYKLIHIKWIDAYGCTANWNSIIDKKPVAHYCYSVGWLVGESAEAIMVVPHLSPENKDIDAEEQGCGEMTIPRVAIMEITDLEFKN